LATLVIWRQELQDQIMELEAQLLERQKTYSGFHVDHPIVPSLRSQIEKLEEEIRLKKSELSNPLTLEQQLIEEQKIKAGYSLGHYILAGARFDTIPILEEKIKKNERLN